MLLSGIHPDLSLEDREVKRHLGKCRPQAYSDLIMSDIPSSSGVSPSCSPRSSSIAGVKGSSREAAEPPLKVLPISVWSPSV